MRQGASGGFQREAVPQACGLRNGLFGRKGGFQSVLCMEICEELRYNFDVESEQQIGI